MKRLVLHRFHRTATVTLGTLYCDGLKLACLERPWIADAPGGTPSLSCVPAGRYLLLPHERPNGDDVLALVNPGLGVYHLPHQRPNKVGRWGILLHSANRVDQIAGCLAPGMRFDGEETRESRQAMTRIMQFGPKEIDIIGENGP